MADDPIHDNPRSPRQQVAEAGDVKPDYQGGELESIGEVFHKDTEGKEYENVDMHPTYYKRLTSKDEGERRKFSREIKLMTGGKNGGTEYWVKRKPTS